MKRRSFFGFAAGAAIAGPGMAKQAATATMESLSVSDGLSQVIGYGGGSGELKGTTTATKQGGGMFEYVDQARKALQTLNGVTAAQRARYRKNVGAHQLDPDIASYRSIALGAKIEMQRDRNLDTMLAEKKSMWQRILDGVTDDEGYLP